MIAFIIKQNSINEKFQELNFEPQLAYYICPFKEMASLK